MPIPFSFKPYFFNSWVTYSFHALLLEKLEWHSITHSLDIRLLPPLLSIAFVPVVLCAYVWQIPASTRNAYFLPNRLSVKEFTRNRGLKMGVRSVKS